MPRVHLLPDTLSVQAALSESSSSVFFWLQQPQSDGAGAAQGSAGEADTVLLGFSLAPRADADAEGLLPVVPAWRTVLPGRRLAMASRDPTEPVHSYVKVRLPATCTAPTRRREIHSLVRQDLVMLLLCAVVREQESLFRREVSRAMWQHGAWGIICSGWGLPSPTLTLPSLLLSWLLI